VSKYLVTYDIENGNTNDYDAVNSQIEKSFPKNCKILTTTYVFSTANSVDMKVLRTKIEKSTSKNVRTIIVGIDGYSWRVENGECLKKYLT